MISYIELSTKMISWSLGTRSWSAVWLLCFFCNINHCLFTPKNTSTIARTTKENRILRWIHTSINNGTNWYSQIMRLHQLSEISAKQLDEINNHKRGLNTIVNRRTRAGKQDATVQGFFTPVWWLRKGANASSDVLTPRII